MKKWLTLALFAGFAAMIGGCGGGSSSSGGGGKAVNVDFSLDPAAGPQCHNTNDISTFRGSFSTIVDCTWQCANYKGQTNVYVSLDFSRRNQPGAQWVFDHEFISDGICF